jgi:hypothetical protein
LATVGKTVELPCFQEGYKRVCIEIALSANPIRKALGWQPPDAHTNVHGCNQRNLAPKQLINKLGVRLLLWFVLLQRS